MGWFFSEMYTGDVQLDGKIAIVTGANNGIGKETAKDLAKRGATVIMACRNQTTAKSAAEDIKKTARGNVIVEKLDLSSLRSVREFADRILSSYDKIHLLINNAGVIADTRTLTENGYELAFGTNHLGHFLLTNLLLSRIIESAPARIVNVASSAHYYCKKFDLEDINLEKDEFDSFQSYCRSKLANVLFTKELARKLQGTGVTTYSLHPGVILTDLESTGVKYFLPWIHFLVQLFIRLFVAVTVEQGAQTTLYCALEEKLDKESGLYYTDCREKKPSRKALNAKLAKNLWDKSVLLVSYCSPSVVNN